MTSYLIILLMSYFIFFMNLLKSTPFFLHVLLHYYLDCMYSVSVHATSLTLSFPGDLERPRPGTAYSFMASATTVILPSSPPCFSLQSCRVERCGTPPPSRGAECGTPLSAFLVVASTGPSICVGTVAIQCCSVPLSSLFGLLPIPC